MNDKQINIMSKDLFLKMREAEIMTDNFLPTKKEIKASAEKFATDLIDGGEINLEETFAQALRLNEALTVIVNKLKSSMPEENFEAFGLKGTFKSGGNTINYKDDEYWSDIKGKLSNREALLKLALNSKDIIYDHEGVEVPKVSTTPRKSSLTINY
jgi:hypothetical protein